MDIVGEAGSGETDLRFINREVEITSRDKRWEL